MTEIYKNKAIQIFKKKQNKYRVIVISGDDKGQVQKISKLAQENFLEEQNELSIKSLGADQWDEYENALIDQSCSPSIFGGKFVIKITEVKQKLTQIIKKYLENPNPDCLIIIQTDYLKPASGLRKIAASNNHEIAFIACYENMLRDNLQIIEHKIAQNGKNIEQNATLTMAKYFGKDQILNEQEIDKLLLFCIDEEVIRAEHVEKIVTDNSSMQSETLCDLVMNAEAKKTIEMLDKIIYKGVNENQILASFIKHIVMMYKIVAQIENEANIKEAVNSYRPMIFFRRKTLVEKQCKIWSKQKIADLMHEIVKTHTHIRSGTQNPCHSIRGFIIKALEIAQKNPMKSSAR